VQPAAKAVKAPAKKEESSSEEDSEEDSEMEDAVCSLLLVLGIFVNGALYFCENLYWRRVGVVQEILLLSLIWGWSSLLFSWSHFQDFLNLHGWSVAQC